MRFDRKIAALLVGSALAGVAAGSVMGADPGDPRVLICGVGTNVEAIIDVPVARDTWKHLPALLRAPELENNLDPATIVVYNGPVSGPVVGRSGIQAKQMD